jgi:hypothetical protein
MTFRKLSVDLAIHLLAAIILGSMCFAAGNMAPKGLTIHDGWTIGAPPNGHPIIGIWYRDIEGVSWPRSHVVVMHYGAGFEYGPGGWAIKRLEDNPPTFWRELP